MPQEGEKDHLGRVYFINNCPDCYRKWCSCARRSRQAWIKKFWVKRQLRLQARKDKRISHMKDDMKTRAWSWYQ